MPGEDRSIEVQLKHIQEDTTDIKACLRKLDKGFSDFKLEYTKEHQVVVNIAEQALGKTMENERKIDKLEQRLAPLIQANKIIAWVGAALGASVMGLIWAIITGQVQIVIP